MPIDPLDHVTSGASLEIQAETWNAMIDAAKYVRARKDRGGGGPLDAPLSPAVHCLLRNPGSSISTLAAFSVQAYSTALIDPSSNDSARLLVNRRPAFEGAIPSSASAPFVVTTQPIQGGSMGYAIVAGLAVAQVSVTDLTHRRALPAVGITAYLASGSANGVPIVWPQTFGTLGQQWCVVLVGDPWGCCPDTTPPPPPPPPPPPGSGGSGGSGSGGSGSGGSGTSPPPPPPCPGLPAVKESGCYGGITRVTSGLIVFVAGCPTWTSLTTTSQGCCACPSPPPPPPPPPPGSGSGGSGGSGGGSGGTSSGGGDGGGGSTFVACCAPAVPNTLHVTFTGALASLGTVTLTNSSGGNSWAATPGLTKAPCATSGLTVALVCNGFSWDMSVTGLATDLSGFGFSQSNVGASSCSPIQITFTATAVNSNPSVPSSCTGAATAVVTL